MHKKRGMGEERKIAFEVGRPFQERKTIDTKKAKLEDEDLIIIARR